MEKRAAHLPAAGSRRRTITLWVAVLVGLILAGCARIPAGITPVDSFSLRRYLGTWYEIARLDHPFERGLSNVTATYRLRPDGGVQVINRGYSERTQRWEEAEGRAYFGADDTTGFLKVSFFGPFYGSYVIMALDRQEYRYSLVCGPDRSYLWILAREPVLEAEVLRGLLDTARTHGFAVDELIYVSHDRKNGRSAGGRVQERERIVAADADNAPVLPSGVRVEKEL